MNAASPQGLVLKPSKTHLRVVRSGSGSHRDVFHVSLFEGPPPASVVVVYAAYGAAYSPDFAFAPVGLPGTVEVHAFASRSAAEAFVRDVFPDVPCSFTPWVSVQMLSVIAGGV